MSCRDWRNPPLATQGLTIRFQWSANASDQPTAQQIGTLEATLGILPFEHLQRFVQWNGYIRASGANCTPARGGGYNPNPAWIRLSHESFGSSVNRTLNFTLLHEFGHWVDASYQALLGLRQSAPDEYRFLVAASHSGRTNWDGERFADCYAIFVLRYLGRGTYNHRPNPGDYWGADGRRRFLALLRTPAFASLQHLQHLLGP